MRYEAGDGLAAVVDDAGRLTIDWRGRDWFGPATRFGTADVDAAITAAPAEPLLTLTLTSTKDITGCATGSFASPSVGWRFDPAARAAPGMRAFGYQYTEFALPTFSDESLARWWLLPFRPNVVMPLGAVAPDGHTLLLAPLDQFHEQVITVPARDDVDRAVRWGWHGDLDEIPAGFTTTLAIVGARSPRAALARFGELVRERHGAVVRPADELGRRISYWTDNGAAYWYRTEPGRDVSSTLTATVEDLRARGIHVGAVQLDSWFYPHEVIRPFNTDEWVVPPSGLTRWEPRDDVLPGGVAALRHALGAPPLVTHCRHLSSSSPYVSEHECWLDGDRAHPADNSLYERWLDQAAAWGVATFEHDWLIESYLGVRQLRAQPGRARAWQEGIDRAAGERGLTLQWCMPSPADLLQAATLRNVTSVRTSGDFAYLVGPGVLWSWFLTTNALARALGLQPYKDVFHSTRADPARHAEFEALLSALSTGPVGIGDALGAADADVVGRTCRADGVIVCPDVPVAATDQNFVAPATGRHPRPLVGETWTDHAAGRWAYVVAVDCRDDGTSESFAVELDSLGESTPAGAIVRWDWRTHEAELLEPGGSWAVDLAPLDWHFSVLAPVLSSGVAVIGDVGCYATAGRARIAEVRDGGATIRLTVLGADETVTIAGWAGDSTVSARRWRGDDGWREIPVTSDGPTWSVDVALGVAGRTDVELSVTPR